MTGTGLVIPQGLGTRVGWEKICNGVSGIGYITRFDTENYPVKLAGEIADFNSEDYFDKKRAKHLDPFTQFAIVAARMALDEAGVTVAGANEKRVGVITGCGIGGLPTIAAQHELGLIKGFRKISPFFVTSALPNIPSGQISMDIGSKGPNLTLSTACAAGTHAVGEAFRHIQYGTSDIIVAGGTEAVICPFGLNGFAAMKALSRKQDNPECASRPFDRDRDGFVMSEGAGILVLEEYEHAVKRGAKIIAEIVGYGLSSDAHHIAAPPESGEGAADAIRSALEDAKLNPEDVDYINAHGTSTPINDVVETRAVKRVFGDNAYGLAISSTKSMTGHMLGGAGGIEAVFTALSLRDQVVPPTINLDCPDQECDLDYVPHEAREMKVAAALSNSFGFGGTNAVIAMRRFDG